MAAFLAVLTLAWATAVAQEAPASEPIETAPEPTTDISVGSQQALRRLDELRVELDEVALPQQALQRVANEEEALDAEFGELAELDSKVAGLSAPQLGDVMNRLLATRDALVEDSRRLDERALTLEAKLTELGEIAETWRAVREQGDLADALAQRIDDILVQAPEIKAIAQGHFNAVTQLQNDVIALTGRMNAIRDRLQRDLEIQRGALFLFQHPPFWSMGAENVADSSQRTVAEVGGLWLKDGETFVAENGTAILVHIATLILLVLAVRALRRVAAERGVMPSDSRVLARPFATSLLVLLLLNQLFYPNAPSTIDVTFGMLAGVTALVVVRPLLDRTLRLAMTVLVGLFVVDALLGMFAGGAPVYRVALMAIGVAMLVLVGFASQARYLDVLAERHLSRSVTRPTFTLGIILLAVAVGLNALGNVELAALLTTGVIRALLTLVVVLMLYNIANDLIALVTRPGFITRLGSVARHRLAIARGARRALVVIATIGWLGWAASFFGLLSPIVDWLGALLRAEANLGDITLSLGRVVAFVVAVWVAVVASRITRALLAVDVLPRMALPRGVPNAIGTTVNYTIVLIGLMVGAGFLGINLTSLGLIFGALGVGIGFGLQNIVNNFVSGLILLFERPIQVDDVVEVGTLLGRVTQIGLRASRVRTFGGAEIIVPNGDLVSQQVTNWTLSDRRRRLEVPVGVAYASDPEEVQTVLSAVVAEEENVLDDPAPSIVFEDFGDSALVFRVYAWIADFDEGFETQTRLRTAFTKALRAAGIEIPFPQADIHLRSIQTNEPLHIDRPGDGAVT